MLPAGGRRSPGPGSGAGGAAEPRPGAVGRAGPRCGVRGTRGRLPSSRLVPSEAAERREHRRLVRSLLEEPSSAAASSSSGSGGTPRCLPRPASGGINCVWPLPRAGGGGRRRAPPPRRRAAAPAGAEGGLWERREGGTLPRLYNASLPLLSPVIPG